MSISIEPYEERARVAMWLFWSAACSENNTVSTEWMDAPHEVSPYNIARSNVIAAFGEWLMVQRLNDDYAEGYGDAAEVAAEMYVVMCDHGMEPIKYLAEDAQQRVAARAWPVS